MGTTTTKTDLAEFMAEEAGISLSAAKRALDAFTDKVTTDLKGGLDVVLTGFGSFSVSHRKERLGRNPQTGEQIKIAASNTAKFKPGKSLKDAVN